MRPHIVVLCIALAGAAPLLTPQASAHPLSALKDSKRVLLVFAPRFLNDPFRTQLASLDGKAMAERDLVLVPVLGTWQRDPYEDEFRAAHAPYTTDAEQAYARHRFHIPPDTFTVILLGKDGGEKFRSNAPMPIDQLNKLIDAMPMRRQEIQSRNPR